MTLAQKFLPTMRGRIRYTLVIWKIVLEANTLNATVKYFCSGLPCYVFSRTQHSKGNYKGKYSIKIGTATATSLLTSCNSLLQQADIRMRSHGLRRLVTTSLLQVVNRLVASWWFQQACCNLFQQIVTSLQLTSCNKPDFNRFVATWWNWQAYWNLLWSCDKPVKLTISNKSVAFLAVYSGRFCTVLS